eukprot:TRINITY_DN69331_c0_g1_i1.p1 TRINITY_DN69331_c0_g1~~TRINITY_DN69331_c0_g1_i1.p1  ORF type:complete len:317 (-),score=25.10 TRINITY_DN69331_c0_g1_i1:37-987(-)
MPAKSQAAFRFVPTLARDLPISGQDNEGGVYTSVAELWESPTATNEWYSKSVEYWKAQEPSSTGMLGGYGQLNAGDLKETREFIQELQTVHGLGSACCLDCGCGIGRVANNVLVDLFDQVDLLDPCDKHLSVALEGWKTTPSKKGQAFSISAQYFHPTPNRYDLIWLQWCSLYLTDDDFSGLFSRCLKSLKRNGLVVLKENVTKGNFFTVDRNDNSITRSREHYKMMFNNVGAKLVVEKEQQAWLEALQPVVFYACKPEAWLKVCNECNGPPTTAPTAPHVSEALRLGGRMHQASAPAQKVDVRGSSCDPQDHRLV